MDVTGGQTKPSKPQANKMVKRFNERIIIVLATRQHDTSEDLELTLEHYCWLYSQHIPQKTLHHQVPIVVMKEWQTERPELFTHQTEQL